MSDKLIVEKHLCRNCMKLYQIIVFGKNENLSKTDKKLLKNDGIIATKQGETIKCPHCKIQIKIE